MEDTFVTVDLTEFEFDSLIDWLGDQQISSGLSKLYDKLIAASEAASEDEQEDDAEDE